MRIVCQKKESNTNRFTAADCWDSSVVRFQFDLPALIYDPIVITYATIAAVGQTFYFRLQVRKSYQVKCRTRKTMVFGFNISSIFEGNRKKMHADEISHGQIGGNSIISGSRICMCFSCIDSIMVTQN